VAEHTSTTRTGELPWRVNAASVRATPLDALVRGDDPRPDAVEREDELRGLVAAHAAEGSGLAATLLACWPAARGSFWLVEPVPAG